jgi:2,3-bisphosphoglycerate-independent phosphoglycerate mutase
MDWGWGGPVCPHLAHAYDTTELAHASYVQVVRGDAVRSFDEVSAARGSLGRFPGSEVMTLIKQFAGVAVSDAH